MTLRSLLRRYLSLLHTNYLYHISLRNLAVRSILRHSLSHCQWVLSLSFGFEVGYGLPTRMVLGNDLVAPYQPIIVEDHPSLQQPSPRLLDGLVLPCYWYPITGMFPFLRSFHILTSILAPVDLSQKLWDSDVGARDALSSFIIEYCLNDAFCFHFRNDHTIIFDDSRDERWSVVLAHLLNRKCVSAPANPLCKFVCDVLSAIRPSNLLCSLLPVAYQNKLVPLQNSSLCSGSNGLYAATTCPRRELQSKL